MTHTITRTTDDGDDVSLFEGTEAEALMAVADQIRLLAHEAAPDRLVTVEQMMEKGLYRDVLNFWNALVEEDGQLPSFSVEQLTWSQRYYA